MPKARRPKRHSSTQAATTTATPENSFSTYIQDLRKEYESVSNKKDAISMKSYLRDQFEFFGIKSPTRRDADKRFSSLLPKWNAAQICGFLQALWEEDEREFQGFAIDFARKYRDILSSNEETCDKSLQCIRGLLTSKSWWDTVDMLATNVVGHFVSKYPDQLNPIMDMWILDDNMWLRRTAILHQLMYKKNTDKERLFRYCVQCCHEKEFFTQKAIGWALRQYSKQNKNAVKSFITENEGILAKLSIREDGSPVTRAPYSYRENP